jgi:DNA-binding beta-propeller fold protein YncE
VESIYDWTKNKLPLLNGCAVTRIMPKEWYISFHGGDEKVSLNNIHVYSTAGKKLRKALNKKTLPEGITLRELRGFVFGPDGNLYVVNAYFEYSEILKFKGALNKDGQHDFAGVLVKRHPESNPGIDHPFNVAFDCNGDLYVSSQNTSLVARYHGPVGKHGQPGRPMSFPQSLDRGLNLPPGTFVPSAKHASNGLVEVREAIFTPDNSLFVADRAADCVRIYDARTGHFLRNLVSASDQVDKPIHLLLSPDGGYLFIGSGGTDSILRHDLRRNATSVFVTPKSGGLNGPAGMTFGDDGFLYVASRNTKEILRYNAENGRPSSKPFIKNLADNPEFLMLVS